MPVLDLVLLRIVLHLWGAYSPVWAVWGVASAKDGHSQENDERL